MASVSWYRTRISRSISRCMGKSCFVLGVSCFEDRCRLGAVSERALPARSLRGATATGLSIVKSEANSGFYSRRGVCGMTDDDDPAPSKMGVWADSVDEKRL